MRVLILESSGNLWGSERALLDLIDSVRDQGITLAGCCPPDRPLQAELKKRELGVLPYFGYALHEKSKWSRLAAAWGLFKACREFRPAVLYVNQAGATRIAGFVSRLLNIPVVAHVRIYEDAAYLAKLKPKASWLGGLIAISHSIAAELRQHPSLTAIPIHTAYDTFVPTTQDPPGDAAKSTTPSLVCVGRITPIKGQEILLEAAAYLKRHGVPFHLQFVGTGAQSVMDELKQATVDSALENDVEWLGFSNEVALLMSGATLLICPSHREPLGRVIFEAWQAGCVPVVFAGSGGAAEIVGKSGAGVLYEKQTGESLGEAIRTTLMLDSNQRMEMIQKGRSWMQDSLNPERYGRRIMEVWESAKKPSLKP